MYGKWVSQEKKKKQAKGAIANPKMEDTSRVDAPLAGARTLSARAPPGLLRSGDSANGGMGPPATNSSEFPMVSSPSLTGPAAAAWSVLGLCSLSAAQIENPTMLNITRIRITIWRAIVFFFFFGLIVNKFGCPFMNKNTACLFGFGRYILGFVVFGEYS